MTNLRETFTGKVETDRERINLYYTHIKVPQSVYQKFKEIKVKRIMVQLNGYDPIHAGFIPVGDGSYFLIASKELLKKHKLSEGSDVEVTIWPDTSKYGIAICEEMKELLEQDEIGSKYFHDLTDGKIRSLLFKANGYKSSDKRLEKSIIILEHLKANNGKLDWKMLNEAFKQGINF